MEKRVISKAGFEVRYSTATGQHSVVELDKNGMVVKAHPAKDKADAENFKAILTRLQSNRNDQNEVIEFASLEHRAQ